MWRIVSQQQEEDVVDDVDVMRRSVASAALSAGEAVLHRLLADEADGNEDEDPDSYYKYDEGQAPMTYSTAKQYILLGIFGLLLLFVVVYATWWVTWMTCGDDSDESVNTPEMQLQMMSQEPADGYIPPTPQNQAAKDDDVVPVGRFV